MNQIHWGGEAATWAIVSCQSGNFEACPSLRAAGWNRCVNLRTAGLTVGLDHCSSLGLSCALQGADQQSWALPTRCYSPACDNQKCLCTVLTVPRLPPAESPRPEGRPQLWSLKSSAIQNHKPMPSATWLSLGCLLLRATLRWSPFYSKPQLPAYRLYDPGRVISALCASVFSNVKWGYDSI